MSGRRLPLLVAGFDAACWEYMTPWLQDGLLPNVQRLMAEGRSGVLHSTMPALTPVAWSTLATGANPGKHGVFEWNRLVRDADPPHLQLHTSATVHGVPFWRQLNARGLRVGLVNIPLTFPTQPLDGFVLCGYPLIDPLRRYLYPPNLLPGLEAELGPYEPGHLEGMLANGEGWYAADERTQAFQVAAAIRLTAQLELDVLVINLMLPDHANHLAPDMAGVQRAYADSDRHLGQLLDALQPLNVMLISDHGSRRIQGKFYINQWLYDQGLLTWAPRTPTDPAGDLNWLLVQAGQQAGLRGPLERVVRNGLRRALRAGNGPLPAWLARRLEQLAPAAYRAYAFDGQADWGRSQFMSFGSLIYANPAAAADAAADVQARLLALTDPGGKPVFQAVLPAGQLYHGPQMAQAPALILDTFSSDWSLAFGPNYRSASYFERGSGAWNGEHSRDGIFVFSGADFSPGENMLAADLADIPATVLYLMDAARPADYDGRVLQEFLAPALLAQRPPSAQPTAATPAEKQGDPAAPPDADASADLTPEQEALMAQQLRALGYVD